MFTCEFAWGVGPGLEMDSGFIGSEFVWVTGLHCEAGTPQGQNEAADEDIWLRLQLTKRRLAVDFSVLWWRPS